MGRRASGSGSLLLGLLSVGLTLGVWADIIARAPQGAFHNQGGMLITFLYFPLTFLVGTVGGAWAIRQGRRALGEEREGGGRSRAVAGIALGVVALLLPYGTCVVPEMIARAVFG